MNENNESALVLFNENHSGRDEMNLAGNPFALLQAASKNGMSFIKYEWERQLPNGKIVTASWLVDGHGELGMPGPSEELLYLVLLQLTREKGEESGEWPRTINFSRYDLLKRLNWKIKPERYQDLTTAFDRLAAVSIHAKHSFYDAKSKLPYEAIAFGIIDDFGIVAEPAGRKASDQNTMPLSWFRWNETLYKSFLAGNLRSMALDYVISLELPTTRRLFRLLDLLRCQTKPARHEVTIGITKLRDRLGMKPYPYISKTKQILNPAIEELKARGYLESVRYEKGKADENAIFRFANVRLFEAEMEQGRVEQASARPTPAKAAGTKNKRIAAAQLTLTDSRAEESGSTIQADALRCHEVFISLPESEQNELLELARKDVSPIWHDRVGQPDSPMSLGLWQLVVERYPEKLK